MIQHAVTLYSGALYVGLILAFILSAYLILSSRSDRRGASAVGAEHGTEATGDATREFHADHPSRRGYPSRAARRRPLKDKTPSGRV